MARSTASAMARRRPPNVNRGSHKPKVEGATPSSTFLTTDWRRPVRNLIAALALGCFSALSASAQTVKERPPTCLACHGETGQSQTPEIPSLGGQQAFYVTVQLLMF